MYMNYICMYFFYFIFFNPAVMKMKIFTEKSDDAHGYVPLQWWCSWLYMSHSSDDSHGYVPLQWWFSWLCPTPVMSHSSDDSYGYVPLQWWCSWLCPTPLVMLMALSHSNRKETAVTGEATKTNKNKKLKNKSVKLSSRDCLSVLCIHIFLWAESLFCHILTLWLSWDERIGEGGVLECDKDFGCMG